MSGTWYRSSSQKGWQTLRAALGPAKRAFFGTAPRAEKDYATHVPILVGLSNAVVIKRVLELGCGEFSTLTFLNRFVFPDLVKLDTFENNRFWLDRVSALTAEDSRVTTNYADGDIETVAQDLNVDEYDLIFIDDSTSADQRARTIAEIASKKCKALVVIHDFEVQEYQKAAGPFEHRFIFKALNPMTGIVWNDNQSRMKSLKRIHGLLKRFARSIEPDDVEGWARVFSTNGV
jgi:hypothetical protein